MSYPADLAGGESNQISNVPKLSSIIISKMKQAIKSKLVHPKVSAHTCPCLTIGVWSDVCAMCPTGQDVQAALAAELVAGDRGAGDAQAHGDRKHTGRCTPFSGKNTHPLWSTREPITISPVHAAFCPCAPRRITPHLPL
jgi:hypothetical protein